MLKFNFARIALYPAPLRLVIFILVLLLLWLPVAAPIHWWVDDKNLVNIFTLPLLYGIFIILLRLWGKSIYHQPQVLQEYGLINTRQNRQELLIGLGLGVASVLSLFLLEGWLGWLWWRQPSIFLWRFVVEGLIVALAYGFAEELLFRGWLLDELQRDYNPRTALWTNACIFAALHFIKPLAEICRTLLQFPALVLLGLTLVWAKRCGKGRLGLPIGLHAGLIWGYYVINVGQMVQHNDRVPEWLTGIDRNPLAGGMGMLFLGAIALGVRRFSHRSR
ncbi:CPBP family intramembrane metalloprotease [cyanobacterium TDX16]|nr:CPBP family intramembrane metalloprotease [cyanobacterium TDX16]